MFEKHFKKQQAQLYMSPSAERASYELNHIGLKSECALSHTTIRLGIQRIIIPILIKGALMGISLVFNGHPWFLSWSAGLTGTNETLFP